MRPDPGWGPSADLRFQGVLSNKPDILGIGGRMYGKREQPGGMEGGRKEVFPKTYCRLPGTGVSM